MKVEVRRQARELTPAQALLEYQHDLGFAPPNKHVAVLDHFPGLAQFPLFMSYAGWLSGLWSWMPRARTPDRVGIRELAPGIWTEMEARVSPKADLRPPCWIGGQVVVNDRCVLGPNVVIERGSMIDSDARVSASYIGPDTYVGRFSEIRHSIARGSTLIDARSTCAIEVPDRFVLSALRQPRAHGGAPTNGKLPGFITRWKSWMTRSNK